MVLPRIINKIQRFLYLCSFIMFLFPQPLFAGSENEASITSVKLECDGSKKHKNSYSLMLPVIIHRNNTLTTLYRYNESDPWLFNLTGRFYDGQLVIKGKEVQLKGGKSGDDWFFKAKGRNLTQILSEGLSGTKEKGNINYERKCFLKSMRKPVKLGDIFYHINRSKKLQNEIKNFKDIAKDTDATIASLKSKNSSYEIKLKKLEANLQNVLSDANVQQSQTEEAEKEISELKKKLQENVGALQAANKIHEQQQKETSSELQKLKQLNSEKDNEISKLNASIESLKKDLTSAKEEEIASLRKELQLAREKIQGQTASKNQKANIKKQLEAKPSGQNERQNEILIFEVVDRLNASTEFGDGFDNFEAERNYRLLPVNICIRNKVNEIKPFSAIKNLYLHSKSSGLIEVNPEATSAYLAQEQINIIKSAIPAEDKICGVVVFEVLINDLNTELNLVLREGEQVLAQKLF